MVAVSPTNLQTERLFELDAIYDGLVSGRLCGQKFAPDFAQLMTVLLERLEWSPDARKLAGALPHFPEVFGTDQVRATLAELGYLSTVDDVLGEQLFDPGRETLVETKTGFALLARRAGQHCLMRPGELGETRFEIQPKKRYCAVRFKQPSSLFIEPSGPMQTSWVGDALNRFAPEFRLMLLLTLFSGLSAILIAFGITKIFDTVIPTRNYGTLAAIMLGLVLLFLLDFSFRGIRADLVGRISGRLEFILGCALLRKLLRLPETMLTGVSLNDQLARLKQFETVRDLIGGPVALLILELPMALILLLTVALIAWPLAFILSVYILTFATLTIMMAPAVRRATRHQSAAQNQLNRVILETLEERKRIGREGLASLWINKVAASLQNLSRARRRLQSLSRWLDAVSHASLPVAAGSVIGVGAVLVMQGSLTGGALVAATILTWRLYAPVQQGLSLFPKIQDARSLLSQIDALMRLPEEESGVEQGQISSEGKIAVQDVVLRYPKSITPVLMGVKLEVPHGSFFTVAGRSGAGKTTLLKVMAGQLLPQAGSVLFNDLNLAQLSRAYRAGNISYVSQNPMYIYGSVAQNLRLADPAADDARLLSVLGELGLEDWIRGLSDGLETRLDPSIDQGVLSASVVSILAVAQALLTEPKVLLLDEAAGNLDVAHEACLLGAIAARRSTMTTILVTHRPSLIARSEKVIILNSGNASVRDTTELQRQVS